jgi:hypothetical protein
MMLKKKTFDTRRFPLQQTLAALLDVSVPLDRLHDVV